MKKKTYNPGLYDETLSGHEYSFVVVVRSKDYSHTLYSGKPTYWQGRRGLRRWFKKNMGGRDYLTPSFNYLDDAGVPVWVVRFLKLTDATAFYLVFGEGV